MGGLIEQVEKKRAMFEQEYGILPSYLIMNAAEAQVLSYEIAVEEGVEDTIAILTEYNTFRNIIICRVNDPNFNEIVFK